MPELIKLDEALDGIMTGIVDLITNATGEEGALQGVETVVRGDRSRPAPVTPAVWVRGMTASCDHTQRSYAEKWVIDVLILGIVKNDEPEQGYKKATELAAKARSEVLKDRCLGNRKYVQDVRSGNFEMGGPDLQNETLFAATAIVQVHFVIMEKNP